ncbi:ATP-binding protein [Weissella cibaria]|uniref:ATP-binding protein n=1 Tax=Weissella cibaria TaxID=137591 RepID=UPI001FF55798|nr:ATP-binding protein [Weissella cibaria]UOX37057.1 ATP-binding protein [Weissella cibaria]
MIERPHYFKQLLAFKDTEFIKVITGIRRSGKSALAQMYAEHLLSIGVPETHVIRINFEDFAFHRLKNADALYTYLTEQSPLSGKIYFIFDEIQMVSDWQRVINSLRVNYDSDITITGSNAQMLSGELATHLSGRYIEINVYPLSFAEFLNFKSIDVADALQVQKAFQEYSRYGGFPAVVLSSPDVRDTILGGIYDTVLLNDVAYRSAIRDANILRVLTNYLAANVGQISSVNNIVNTLKSAGISTSIPTISSYLALLENAYLFHRAQRYDLRGKAFLRSKDKFCIADNGLRRAILGGKQPGVGSELENLVYIELLRRGYTVDIGQLDSGTEIDFIARRNGQVTYIQVTYQIPENSTRKTDNLLHIRDNYEKLLITQNYFGNPDIDGIPVINIIDWLVNENDYK